MSELMLDVGQANEIKLAARKAGATNADLKALSSGDVFAQILPVLRGIAKVVPIKLLELVSTVKLPAVARFVARDAFGENNPDGIKFHLWSGFGENFLSKVEENVPKAELAIHTLTRPSLDQPIRDELTSRLEETTPTHLYELIKRQPKGKAGVLLTNGKVNIFYIRDTEDKLWAVVVRWDSVDREWGVDAFSVASPSPWLAGGRVVSRKAA